MYIVSIDCHIHLFKKGCSAISNARHTPSYDAELATVCDLGATVGVTRFVLVQTSFMGTDNDYLLQHLRASPERLRGVFILDASTSREQLRQLKSESVVGIRLNLFQTDLAVTLSDAHLGLIERCSLEGLSVGLHDDAARLIGILDRIAGRASRLVVDHFGRPESLALGQDDPGYDRLLERLVVNNSYVKISAPYRSPAMNPDRAYAKLKQTLGEDKLLWASDWPWTQNEESLTYAQWANSFPQTENNRQEFSQNLPARLAENAKLFYGFA
jgi:predicted TIM-barrel fold metal-dependent hydrolase